MLLRKINAGLSLLSTALLLEHAIFMAVWMLSRGAITQAAAGVPRILFGSMMAHAFISMVLALLGQRGTQACNCKGYSNLNLPTVIQRASGVLMVPFTVLHIAGATGVLQPPQIVHAILPPLFFALCLAHTSVSASKAFITLGIGNAGFVKAVDVAMKLLCGATLIANVAGFYLYVV